MSVPSRKTNTFFLGALPRFSVLALVLINSPIASAFTHSSRSHRTAATRSFSSLKMSTDASKSGRNFVVIGGGIQGTSVAYQLHESSSLPAGSTITLLESKALASAASGKGGGFMARSWGDGTPTQRLHELAFDSYETLAETLDLKTYRKLPVLSVAPGYGKEKKSVKERNPALAEFIPDWLDGSVGRLAPMGYGEDTAQVTPTEFVSKMMDRANDGSRDDKPGVSIVFGTCTGIEYEEDEGGSRKVTGVKYTPRDESGDGERILPADDVVVSAGPWACQAEDWFEGAVELPMEGIKSTSIVWKDPTGTGEVDATALFCGEDNRFGTHLEVYPRPDGTIYICGIGGSQYITKDQLKEGAFREQCDADQTRVSAAADSFQSMSSSYATNGELEKSQACMRPCPPDAMPYIGRVPGYSGAYVNAGHNCWGIAWAPATGMAVAELLLEGRSNCVDLRPFDPARFTPKAGKRGGRGRKKGNESVGEQW